MKCRKCKLLKEKGGPEEFIVHIFETHGVPLEISLERFKTIDKEKLNHFLLLHKETGSRNEKFKITNT